MVSVIKKDESNIVVCDQNSQKGRYTQASQQYLKQQTTFVACVQFACKTNEAYNPDTSQTIGDRCEIGGFSYHVCSAAGGAQNSIHHHETIEDYAYEQDG